MSIDGAEFWMADESPQHLNFSPESLGGGTVRMILVAENPDAVLDQAVANGSKAISPIADQRYHWEIGKPLF